MSTRNALDDTRTSRLPQPTSTPAPALRVALKTNIVVIGAGQAGLSSAYHLKKRGLAPGQEFVVLDQSPQPGGAWQFRWPENMRLGAACITDSVNELLAKLWRAALAAAASIDPADETLVGHKVNLGNLHRYYRMFSGMVEEILQERMILQQKKYAELKEKIAEREPDDLSDFSDGPF